MKTLPQVYSQRDPRWSAQRLGTVNGTTIGSDGCYVTSFAMIAGFFRHSILPNELDNIYTDKKLYAQGNLCTDDMLPKVFADIKYETSYKFPTTPADLGQLKQLMDDPNKIVILCLDFDHDPNDGIQTHFLVCVGADGGKGIKVADPWYGSVDDFALHYGNDPAVTIQKFVVYSGVPVAATGDTYKGLDLSNKESMKVAVDVWDKLQKGELVGGEEINHLNETIHNLNTVINEKNRLATEKDSVISTLTVQSANLKAEVERLSNQDIRVVELDKLLKQAEKDKMALRDNVESLNRQNAQLKNSSYLTAPIKTILTALLKRKFS